MTFKAAIHGKRITALRGRTAFLIIAAGALKAPRPLPHNGKRGRKGRQGRRGRRGGAVITFLHPAVKAGGWLIDGISDLASVKLAQSSVDIVLVAIAARFPLALGSAARLILELDNILTLTFLAAIHGILETAIRGEIAILLIAATSNVAPRPLPYDS